ncbi:MAG TPA: signal peptidase II [bacterium]|nr:signal peptidase II [bacterium]
MHWSPRARVFWPVLVTILIADCTTKELAEAYLAPESTPHQVAGTAVRFTLAHNSGAAMGLSLGPYSRIGFSAVACLAVLVLVRLYRATSRTDRRRAVALALLVGGAVGNLGNRLLSPRGVTDFIDIGVRAWRFWTFNIADVGITFGAALLVLVLWHGRSATEADALGAPGEKPSA